MHTTAHANRPVDSSSRPERSFRVIHKGPHHLRHSGDRPSGAPSSTTSHTARLPAIRKEACFLSWSRYISRETTAGISTVGYDCSTKTGFSRLQERSNVLAVYAKASCSFPTGRSSSSFTRLSGQLSEHLRIVLSTRLDHLFFFTFTPVLLVSLVHKL